MPAELWLQGIDDKHYFDSLVDFATYLVAKHGVFVNWRALVVTPELYGAFEGLMMDNIVKKSSIDVLKALDLHPPDWAELSSSKTENPNA